MELAQILSIILIAISLSACTGLRAFLPPLALSLFAMSGHITLAPNFQWLATWEVATIFGVAAVLEIVADKFPGVDNMLDAAGLVIKPLAGALLTTSMIQGMDPVLAVALGIIVGGGIAGTVHLGKAKLRLLSTGLTGGMANPVVSFFEDGVVILGAVLGVFLPWLVAAVVVVMLVFIWRSILGHFKKKEEVGI